MDISLTIAILFISATVVLGQRPFFAGTEPIGYPSIPNITNDGLGDRFGEVDGTTPKIPVEAHGDWGFIDRLSKLPIDKQPFWFINWQAYEAQRKNPQTYPQRPNSFIDPIPTSNNANSGVTNVNSGTPNSNSAPTTNSDSSANRFGEPDSNSNVTPAVLPTSSGNKNGESKPNPAVKPVVTEAPLNNNKKEDSSKVGSTTSNSNTTNSNSTGNKVEEVAPIVPSPIEPDSKVADGLKLKLDPNDSKKYRYF